MLALSAVETVLVQLFGSITGIVFIIADQDAPRPLGQYGALRLLSVSRKGWDSTTFENQSLPDLDLIENIKGLRTLTVSTNIYREDALQKIEDLSMLLQSSSSQSTMRKNGLGLGLMSESRNLDELLDNQTEQRAQIDIDFYVASEAQLITSAIAAINITGTHQYAGKSTPITVEVP